MKLSKKGQSGIGAKATAVIFGVIGVVVLVSMAPDLWQTLDNALNETATANIPFISNMTGIIGLLFGVAILLGAIYGIMSVVKRR